MVKLEPMTNEQYASWLTIAINEYAEDKARAGNVTRYNALEVSKREFNELLPDGLKTPDTYIFNVVDQESNHIVGMLLTNKNFGLTGVISTLKSDAGIQHYSYVNPVGSSIRR